MSEYLSFEKEMNDRDIKFNRRWIVISLSLIIFLLSVLIMNLHILYNDPKSSFNAFSCGLLTFTIILNIEQHLFFWSDYKQANRLKSLFNEFDIEEKMRQDNIYRRPMK